MVSLQVQFYALIGQNLTGEFMRKISAAIKSLLLFMASLFIGFMVEKYVACQSQKSDFGWHRFRFSPCLMRKRVEKSEAILASNLMKSSVVYGAI